MADVPNRELVVYVVALLGGASKHIHTEDIAVKCHELFPASFSWTKYTDFPDKDIVRVALTDARKIKQGALVDGRAGEKHGHAATTNRKPAPDGWTLTQNGIRWVSENRVRLDRLLGGSALKEHRQKILKELAKHRRHSLFLSYLREGADFEPAIGEIADFVRCRVDAPEDVWAGRFDALERKAEGVEQRDLVDFLTKCRKAYLGQR